MKRCDAWTMLHGVYYAVMPNDVDRNDSYVNKAVQCIDDVGYEQISKIYAYLPPL